MDRGSKKLDYAHARHRQTDHTHTHKCGNTVMLALVAHSAEHKKEDSSAPLPYPYLSIYSFLVDLFR